MGNGTGMKMAQMGMGTLIISAFPFSPIMFPSKLVLELGDL